MFYLSQNAHQLAKLEWIIVFTDWAWRGRQFALRACAVLAALLSAAIVWSEATFFVHQPVLSLLALVFNAQRATYAYLSIEVNRVEEGGGCTSAATYYGN